MYGPLGDSGRISLLSGLALIDLQAIFQVHQTKHGLLVGWYVGDRS